MDPIPRHARLIKPVMIDKPTVSQGSALRDNLLSLDEVVRNYTEIEKLVESATKYNSEGYGWFYLASSGTRTERIDASGYSEINTSGTTIETFFVPVRDISGKTLEEGGDLSEIKSAFFNLETSKRARLLNTRNVSRINIVRKPTIWRILVDSEHLSSVVAPLMIIREPEGGLEKALRAIEDEASPASPKESKRD